MSGKRALRWSMRRDDCDREAKAEAEAEVGKDLGGEKRAGEEEEEEDGGGGEEAEGEEEQRILLETEGVVGRSSNMDLLPHTMADMFRLRLLGGSLPPPPLLSQRSIRTPILLLRRAFHATAPFRFPILLRITFYLGAKMKIINRNRKLQPRQQLSDQQIFSPSPNPKTNRIFAGNRKSKQSD